MTDLQRNTSLIEQSNNFTALPDPLFNQLQAIANLINHAVEDQALCRQGMGAIEGLHQQMLEMVQGFGEIIEAVIEERDTALDNLAATEEARDEAQSDYEALASAVRWRDHSDPLVSALIEQVEEMAGEVAMEYAFEVSNENLIDNLMEITGLSHRECSNAAEELTSGWSTEMSDETVKVIEIFLAKAKEEKAS